MNMHERTLHSLVNLLYQFYDRVLLLLFLPYPSSLLALTLPSHRVMYYLVPLRPGLTVV